MLRHPNSIVVGGPNLLSSLPNREEYFSLLLFTLFRQKAENKTQIITSLPKGRDHLGKPSVVPAFITCGVREIGERGEGQERGLGTDGILPVSNTRDSAPKPMPSIIRRLSQSQTHATSTG